MSPSPEGLRLPPAAAGSLYYHSKEIAPQSVHDERQGKLVVGRDGAAKPKRKPAVAPKPAIKKTLTSSSITQTSTTRGISTASTGGDDTSTGDSGFVDARKYRKEFSPPKVVPRHKYTPLNAEQKEAAAYYTATNTTTAQGKGSYSNTVNCVIYSLCIDKSDSICCLLQMWCMTM